MDRKLAVILIAVAFIFGIAGGGFADRYYSRKFVSSFYASMEASHARSTLATLKNLRANNITNSIELLEGSLDGSLEMLDATMDYFPKSEQNKELKVFTEAKQYRVQFPRRTESLETDQAVSNALSRAETNK